MMLSFMKITLPVDISSEYLDDRGQDLINAFFIDDSNVYGSSRSSLSGLITKAGRVALTADDAVSFVSATIEKPNTSTVQGAPATLTETKNTVADIGGLTFDPAKKTWSFDATHTDYAGLDLMNW